MPYAVRKMIEDGRNNTVGMLLPDGGVYWVVEMTFENYRQLLNLSQIPGYSVDYVDGETGFFDKDGCEIDQATLTFDPRFGRLSGYELKTKRVRGGKEIPKKAQHEDKERDSVVAEAQSLGLKTKWQSTQSLKQKISEAKRAPQSTLTAQ